MNIGSRIKEEIEFSNLSYKELSAKTGIAEGSLYNYVSSTKPSIPPADVAVKIARALGVTVEYLVTGQEVNSSLDTEAKKVAYDYCALCSNDKKSIKALIKEMKAHK